METTMIAIAFLTAAKFIRPARMPLQTQFAPSRVKIGILDASHHLPEPILKLAFDIRLTFAPTLGEPSSSLLPRTFLP